MLLDLRGHATWLHPGWTNLVWQKWEPRYSLLTLLFWHMLNKVKTSCCVNVCVFVCNSLSYFFFQKLLPVDAQAGQTVRTTLFGPSGTEPPQQWVLLAWSLTHSLSLVSSVGGNVLATPYITAEQTNNTTQHNATQNHSIEDLSTELSHYVKPILINISGEKKTF